MFQFLIGRVKIFFEMREGGEAKKFQFLIGRVKIVVFKCDKFVYMHEFQFLIGRVKI